LGVGIEVGSLQSATVIRIRSLTLESELELACEWVDPQFSRWSGIDWDTRRVGELWIE